MKNLEKLRAKETDPKICLKLLELYEEIGKILGPEEVGMKILPGIIPMLISGQFTKGEFKDLMSTVRRLLDQIEGFRLPTLPDNPKQGAGLGGTSDIFSSMAQPNNSDPMAFLQSEKVTNQVAGKDPFAFNSSDLFSGIGSSPAISKDPFSTPAIGSLNLSEKKPKKQEQNLFGGWDNEEPKLDPFSNSSSKPKQQDPFSMLDTPSS